MSHFEIAGFISVIFFLILLSAFFSSAETGLMAINRYRLRHQARLNKNYAVRILKLLKRPDRLLGTILIGNTVANIIAASLANYFATHVFGEAGIVLALTTALLTLIVLVFAEVAPKTLAALYPDKVSRWVALPVYLLVKLMYPLVWTINMLSNTLLRLFNVRLTQRGVEPLSREELRSVVFETTGKVTQRYQNMLLSILDLNKMTIEDVMIPAHEVIGINLNLEWSDIQAQISKSAHDWLPVYRGELNELVGLLHLRELMHSAVSGQAITKESLIATLHEAYFIPEGTPLNIQLENFQQKRKRLALVVDEYGQIEGLVTLEDILEEIVGDFTTSVTVTNKFLKEQTDGSYLVDGGILIREMNRITEWKLPTRGPRTLSGLIVEYLESMPHSGTCVLIANHPIEILQVEENRVVMARVYPGLAVGELPK